MRVPHCRRTPPGWTPDAPAPIAVRSKTVTRAQRACSSCAIARPTTPAPTTATSLTAAQVCERGRAEANLGERRGAARSQRRLRQEANVDLAVGRQREMPYEPPGGSVGRGGERESPSDARDPQPDS